MTKRRSYEELEDAELAPEIAARVEAAIVEAARDLEDAQINFQWGAAQLDVVKKAAQLAGVPYPSYIKQVVWRQAVEDMKTATSLGLVELKH